MVEIFKTKGWWYLKLFHFIKNNKEDIISFMNKKLKELFVQNKETDNLNELKSELLKQKIETKYEDVKNF